MRLSIDGESALPASATLVWDRVTTAAGINDELWPVLRMTAPGEWRARSLTDVSLGQRLCRSWMLLLGVLPIGYDDLTLTELGPGFRFREVSPMTGMRYWEHERTVTAEGGGSRIHDRMTFELAAALAWLPGADQLSRFLLRTLLKHRHRRLRSRFRAVPARV
jgi:hypothetical protein